MDATHVHLLLNHFPIIGTLLGLAVMGYGYITSSDQVKKAALLLWILIAVLAIPVFLTGEPAEEAVEDLAGVSEAMIHEHEEAAGIAFWFVEALGLFALLTLVLFKNRPGLAKNLLTATTVWSLVAFGAMVRTGYLGGQIRHSEIRNEQTTRQNDDQGEEVSSHQQDDDDLD